MAGMQGGMELWAIVPELTLVGMILVLLPLGSFLPSAHKSLATWVALIGLLTVGIESAVMVTWPAQTVFLGTYVVDPFAVYFKVFAVVATMLTLLATQSHFCGDVHEGHVPALLLLVCLGIMGLAASQDLALIALFLQLITIGTYILVGINKQSRLGTEAAVKMFLYAAAVSAIMIYGMVLLFGLTGTLRLSEMATKLPAAPLVPALAALFLLLFGYGFEVTLVPFHMWVPDTYQGAPTPISGFLSVGPKAAGLAVLVRTLVVAFPHGLGFWPDFFTIFAAITMTTGNVLALRQTSTKRLLAYSSIGQVGYMLVGVATASLSSLAIPGLLFYLAVYLLMNLGAFLAVDAIERQVQTDDLRRFAGIGRQLPLASAVLSISLLALAGFPPFGRFVGKTLLFGAVLAAGWTWLALVMLANIALSLFYYVRVLVPIYLQPGQKSFLSREAPGLRVALLVLGLALLMSGVFPQMWVEFATHASSLFLASSSR
jgi:NADH-quinone oxidoreductase subunit N